jgi:hypothetical protein
VRATHHHPPPSPQRKEVINLPKIPRFPNLTSQLLVTQQGFDVNIGGIE